MNEMYLFSIVNLALCIAILVISLCRLNTMDGSVLYRVRSEYAGYVASAFASGLQPWWGEWPRWGSLSIAAAILLGLLCSSHAWRRDVPPSTATVPAPLENDL